MITVAIYAEHTAQAGQRCYEFDAENPSDDVVIFSGTPRELKDMAREWKERAADAGAGRDLFMIRVGNRLFEAAENE